MSAEPDGRTAERHDFATNAARAAATAAVLAELGVAGRDRVFLKLPRLVQWYDVLLGCFHLGAVPMPATMQFSPRDVAYRVNLAEPATVVTDTAGLAAVDAAQVLPAEVGRGCIRGLSISIRSGDARPTG